MKDYLTGPIGNPAQITERRGNAVQPSSTAKFFLMVFCGILLGCCPLVRGQTNDPNTQALAREVATRGWIVFGAKTERGDWDLFLMRPDGSALRNITQTPDFNEGLPRFSADGRRLLYRRLPRGESFDNNRHGSQGALVFARADGSESKVFGKAGEYPWASWSPDGNSIACLSPKGIDLIDLTTKNTTKHLDRKGFFQQITWSPDGRWLSGVANSFDTGWAVARMELATGTINAACTVDCCTPDWFPDSRNIVYSWRPPGQKVNKGYGWTRLYMAKADGSERRLLYAEPGRHVYGGCVSPDAKYVLFTGNKEEDGDPENNGAPMGLMRLADAPIIRGNDDALRQQFPGARTDPVLQLPNGWEPHWTMTELKPQ
jgi:Tol biopolymer transport system component